MSQRDQPLKVLVVCSKYPPEYSGSGLRAHRTYLRLRSKYQVSIEVLCSSMVYMSRRNETYEVDGMRVTRLSSPFKRRLVAAMAGKHRVRKFLWYALAGLEEIWRTMTVLRRHGKTIDVVHTFGHCWSAGVAAIWAGVLGKPIFRELVTMQSRPDDPPGLRRLVRWALSRRGTIIAISPLLAERARQLGYRRVWCRPNPVDELRFTIARDLRDVLRHRYTPFGPDDIVLADLAKYSKMKNKELLLGMMALLPPRYKLVMVGPMEDADQPLTEDLAKLIRTLGIHDRVILHRGFVDHPEHYLQLADVFLFPSLSDGLGTPVLEAICCGIPVVANRIAGVTDWWIRDQVNGVLCEATARDFARGVERALEIPHATLDRAAQDLINQAGNSMIDEAYMACLRGEISTLNGS